MTESTVFDPAAFGARLKEALVEKGMDVKSFQEALVEKTDKARGTSYGAVWSYVNGQAPLDPRREVVEAMGELLGLSPRWLLYGEDPKSPAHGAEEEASREAQRPNVLVEGTLDEIARGLGNNAPAVLSGATRRAVIIHTWRRLVFTKRGETFFLDGSLGRRIGEALAAPLAALEVSADSLPDRDLDDFVMAQTAALRHLYPEQPTPTASIRTRQEAPDAP